MGLARQLLLRHRAAAALVVVLALLMKLLVPAGFMPVAEAGTIRIVPCSGYGPVVVPPAAMPGMEMTGGAHHAGAHAPEGHQPGEEHADKTGGPCVFSGLAAPALSGADALLLAGAILFVVMLAVRTPGPRLVAVAPRLRPPLRGPPPLR